MPDDYMDREVASVGGTKYPQQGKARKQAEDATKAAQTVTMLVPPPSDGKKQVRKRGGK